MTPDVVELLRAGRFAEIRELFAPQLRPLVPAGTSRSLPAKTGCPKRFDCGVGMKSTMAPVVPSSR